MAGRPCFGPVKWALRLPSNVGDSFFNFLVLLALFSGCKLLQHLVSCAVFFFLLYGTALVILAG